MARVTDSSRGIGAWGRRAVVAALLLAVALAGAVRSGAAPVPWMNTSLTPGERAACSSAR